MRSNSLTIPTPQKLCALLLVIGLISASLFGPMLAEVKSARAANAVVTTWSFNSLPADGNASTGTLIAVSGNGTGLSVIGTSTGSFLTGNSNESDDSSYVAAKYPSQGTGNLNNGIEFTVSTIGYQNILLEFDRRHTINSPNRLAIQYSINGANFITHTFVTANNGQENTFIPTIIDLTSVTAVDEKTSVRFRIVAAFAEGTAAYAPTKSSSSYSSLSSSIRFDNLYVRADAQAAATSTPTKTNTPTPTPTITATPTNTATPTPTAKATTAAGGQCTDYAANNLNQAIPDTTFDEESGIYTFGVILSSITVPTNFSISNLDILNFNLSHQYMNDLKAELISPQGVVTLLFATIGNASDAGFVGTTFDDQAGTPISAGTPPFSGSYKPTGPFYAYNAAMSAGQWRLRITDKQVAHIGTLTSWTLRLCTGATPTPTATPTKTNTPGGPTEVPGATATPGAPTTTPTPEIDYTKGNINIVVDAQPNSGQNFDFTFVPGNFTLDDASPDDGDAHVASKTMTVAPGGPYAITANIPPEWTVMQINCIGSGSWNTLLESKTVKITVDAGDLADCTYVIAYTSPNTPTSTPAGPTHTPTNTAVAPTNTPGGPTATPGGATVTPTSTTGGTVNTPTNTPVGGNSTPTNTPTSPIGTPTATGTPTTDPSKGRLTIRLDAQPDSGQDFDFFAGSGDFALDDASPDDSDSVGSVQILQLAPGGPYPFTIFMPGEWSLMGINCAGTGTADVSSDTLNVTLAQGDALTCTFAVDYTSVNTPTPMPTPTATKDPREVKGSNVFLPIINR